MFSLCTSSFYSTHISFYNRTRNCDNSGFTQHLTHNDHLMPRSEIALPCWQKPAYFGFSFQSAPLEGFRRAEGVEFVYLAFEMNRRANSTKT